ncbi:MAG: MBL fold metallo-hydrolase, partial [Flammeovirgaceae bacterium]
KDFALITDPWIEGRVFNDAWAHMVPSSFTYEDFKDITHIWFSHEHPDHFFPPNISKIPAEAKQQITILFQETQDKKVVNFCKKQGFKAVIELPEMQWVTITPDIQVILGKEDNHIDSYLTIKTPELTFVNLNDCVITRSELEELRQQIGEVDVLFTQFSYANWIGNKADKESHKRHANEKLAEIKLQLELLQPRYVIPFASYVWFCHEDNFYMNEGVNRISSIYEYISSLNIAKPVVLYPDDTWAYNTAIDSKIAIERYEQAFEAIIQAPQLTSPSSIPLEDLKAVSEDFKEKSLKLNNPGKLKSLPACVFYVTDYDYALSFSFSEGLQRQAHAYEQCDVALSSQALWYCLKFLWGWDTLLVAGIFQKPPQGNFQHYMEYEWVAKLNNNGLRMGGILERLGQKIKDYFNK